MVFKLMTILLSTLTGGGVSGMIFPHFATSAAAGITLKAGNDLFQDNTATF